MNKKPDTVVREKRVTKNKGAEKEQRKRERERSESSGIASSCNSRALRLCTAVGSLSCVCSNCSRREQSENAAELSAQPHVCLHLFIPQCVTHIDSEKAGEHNTHTHTCSASVVTPPPLSLSLSASPSQEKVACVRMNVEPEQGGQQVNTETIL